MPNELAEMLMRGQSGLPIDPTKLSNELAMQDYGRALQHGTIQRPGMYGPHGGRLGITRAEEIMSDAVLGLSGGIAWHGSPHKFSKFDMSKIGTGEGAQAYGHGLYFADIPSVAKTYTAPEGSYKRLSGHLSPKAERAYDYLDQGMGITDVMKNFNKAYGGGIDFDDMMKAIDEAKAAGAGQGNLYKVDIPDDAINKMLDWDKPLSEQPEILKMLDEQFIDGSLALQQMGVDPNSKKSVQALYNSMGGNHKGDAVSAKMKEWGVPGIKYLDQGSRGKGAGTYNYVVFDDQLPTILERNGQPIQSMLAKELMAR